MNTSTTTEVRTVGPYRVMSNGRKILEFASKVRAEQAAAKVRGATVQGRRVEVVTFGQGRS